MKRLFYLFVVFISLSSLAACSQETENNRTETQIPSEGEDENVSEDATEMSRLTDDQKTVILDELNSIAPDTYDEGEFGPWNFTDLRLSKSEALAKETEGSSVESGVQEGDQWTLHFTNSKGESFTSFSFVGTPLEDEEIGIISEEFYSKLNEAISDWEMNNSSAF